MAILVYQVGDLVRIDIVVKDIAGALVDPTTLELRVTKPSGTTDSYTLALGAITRDSLGTFHKDVSASERGPWYYSSITTGTGQAAENGQFYVEATA